MKIIIIDYGAGNVFSLIMALKRLGYNALLTNDANEIQSADKVIFPGVGQASAAMTRLKCEGLDTLIPLLQMPVLGICLGMQLMCNFTEEESTEGLKIFPVNVSKIDGINRVPHMGWNNIVNLKSELFSGVNESEWMYFVHSYYVPDNPYSIANCNYHTLFSAAIQYNNFYGCQFHPEKSADIGEKILMNFIKL